MKTNSIKYLLTFVLILFVRSITQSQNQVPLARWGHQMTYDAERKQTLFFGGSHNGQDRGDLWAWNGDAWKLLSESGPAPRVGSVFVYDPLRKETILFGGRSNEELLSDTWKWDGANWTKLEVTGPQVRSHVVGVYDNSLKGIVVVGGFGSSGPLTDTWMWNGSRWTKLNDSAPAESLNQSMAFDNNAQRLVLLTVKLSDGKTSETWEFKNAKWEKVPCSTPLNTHGTIQGIATDGKNGIFLFDGDKGISWNLKKSEYKKLNDLGPSGRSAYTLTYDLDRNKIVLFGGGIPNTNTRFNELWEWDGNTWRKVEPK